jgi:hypothetical protein
MSSRAKPVLLNSDASARGCDDGHELGLGFPENRTQTETLELKGTEVE